MYCNVIKGRYLKKKPTSSLGTNGVNSMSSSTHNAVIHESWPHQKWVSPTDNLLIAFPFQFAMPYGHLDIPDHIVS